MRGDGHAGSVTGFLLAVFAFFVAMAGTTLPTPLYPLFEQRYGFGPLLVTVIFAIYAFGVIAGLILFGNLSDRLGRKPLLFFGLVLSGASALLFLVAGSLVPIYAARIISGLSAGIFTGTATAYVLDLAPGGRSRLASFAAVFANLGGLGAGALLAGLLAEWAPDELRTVFAVDLVLVGAATAGLLLAPETVTRHGSFALRLQRLGVPEEVRTIFVRPRSRASRRSPSPGSSARSLRSSSASVWVITVRPLPACSCSSSSSCPSRASCWCSAFAARFPSAPVCSSSASPCSPSRWRPIRWPRFSRPLPSAASVRVSS